MRDYYLKFSPFYYYIVKILYELDNVYIQPPHSFLHMTYTILDCYTDEPAGLGVPPYLGTYPRYLYGALGDAYYLTIDDVRLWKKYGSRKPDDARVQKTNVKVHNLTRNYDAVEKILRKTKTLVVIV